MDPSDTVHPRQTEFFIKAKPPDVGNITYQVDQRAVELLSETLGYNDGDELPWSLVHVLRQVRDLFTLDEGRPRGGDDDDSSIESVSVPDFDEDEATELVDYLRDHPDVTGDMGAFETQIKDRDESYLDAIRRDGYTPSSTPGFDATGNEALDRIVEEYFGDKTQTYIEWNGKRVYDYIVVTDRNGEEYQFPRIDSRLPEGERLRFSRDIYRRWGPEIGESEVNSRRYEADEDGFPNRWIGQRKNDPEPSLEQAESPRAFFYRTLAGRSHYAPGKEADNAFEEACEYSLEVYKANFPTAVDPRDLQTEYETPEKATEPWHDFQVPPQWVEKYEDTGGLPPLKQASRIPERLSEDVRSAIRRHSPGGSGHTWFDSVESAVERYEDGFYRDALLLADEIDHPVIDFNPGWSGQPVFDISFHSNEMELDIFPEEGDITIESNTGGTHEIRTINALLVSWRSPETETHEAAHEALEEQAAWFSEVSDLVEMFTESMRS